MSSNLSRFLSLHSKIKIWQFGSEDNAPFRFQPTWVNAQLDYALFGTSHSKQVLPGKDGWFFYKENEPEAI